MLVLMAIPEPDCMVVSFGCSCFISGFNACHQQRQLSGDTNNINGKNIRLMYVQVKFYNFNFMNPVASL